MGSKPPKDPMEEIQRSSLTVRSDDEIRWRDRSTRKPWMEALFLSFSILGLVFYWPRILLAASLVMCIMMLAMPRIYSWLEMRMLEKDEWQRVSRQEPEFASESKRIIHSILEAEKSYIVGLDVPSVSPRLQGTLGRLLRALDTKHGLSLRISMKQGNPKHVIDKATITRTTETYLSSRDPEEMQSYFTTRGGVWKVRVAVLGHGKSHSELRMFENSFRGAVPERKIRRVRSRELATRIKSMDLCRDRSAYYATAKELAGWLVQLATELSSEVGSNVPAEFIAPIRPGESDYRLGLIVNPETLRTGKPAGLKHSDLNEGLIVCGGENRDRHDVLVLLVNRLIESGKRVLVISSRREVLELAGFSESGVGLVLGKDLVINPMNAEGIPHNRYIGQLLLAIEVLAGTTLSAAPEFEKVLGKAIALSHSTVADVRFGLEPESAGGDISPAFETDGPTKESRKAMDAVRILHEGRGATAFYGTQTVPTSRLAELPLAIVVMSTGSLELDMFAWDLICLKLGGLPSDDNLVVILDEPENLRVSKMRGSRHSKRGPLTEKAVEGLLNRGPLVAMIAHPSDLTKNTTGYFSSCIAMRMNIWNDIAAADDLLGLSVVRSGLHSKARHSPQESSFLHVLDSGFSLFKSGASVTCMPVQLDEMPATPVIDKEEMAERISNVINETQPVSTGRPRSMLDRIAYGQEVAKKVLGLLTRYEPLTDQAIRTFLRVGKEETEDDVESVITRLEHDGMILRGHEMHSGVSYRNFRITMKGTMALREAGEEST